MRFLMFKHGNGRRLGVLAEGRSDTAVDLTELAHAPGVLSGPPTRRLFSYTLTVRDRRADTARTAATTGSTG